MARCWIALFFTIFTSLCYAGELKVHFTNLKNSNGNVLYLIFDDEDGYPDKNAKSLKEGKISAPMAIKEGLNFTDLPDGGYAITAFHDENNNDKLDTGLFGIPKEGFAFSNNPSVFFGPPSYLKSKFKVQGRKKIKLKFKYF